ncbi:MAG: PEP-CTERM sorting domain-containing protein [Planctomycetes bacterium]|nr:PEP-CTERM sorting domain-containing protein [Planctomycetota bacterium]
MATVRDVYRSLRGGSQNAYAYHLSAPCRGDTLYSPTHEGGIGFRISQVPEPAALSLLALGGLLALRRRR